MTKASKAMPVTGLRTRKVAKVDAASPAAVIAGSSPAITFAGGVIVKGVAYGDAPAVDLNLTINAAGNVVLPDEDTSYDVQVQAFVSCDAADVGKLVALTYWGSDSSQTQWVPVSATGGADFQMNLADRVFSGWGPQQVTLSLNASALTQDASLLNARVAAFV